MQQQCSSNGPRIVEGVAEVLSLQAFAVAIWSIAVLGSGVYVPAEGFIESSSLL